MKIRKINKTKQLCLVSPKSKDVSGSPKRRGKSRGCLKICATSTNLDLVSCAVRCLEVKEMSRMYDRLKVDRRSIVKLFREMGIKCDPCGTPAQHPSGLWSHPAPTILNIIYLFLYSSWPHSSPRRSFVPLFRY